MKKILALALTALLLLSGCTGSTAMNNDQEVTDKQLQKYQQVQPVPQYDWSQYRQTVIDVTAAQANAVATTTFMFNMGTADPIDQCPSIGFPVPSTAQLTNPQQITWRNGSDSQVVAQAEPNGAYTGDSSGTYVVCVASDGTAYIDYWEGAVKTTGGPAHWDYDKHHVVLDGKPTVTTKSKG